MTKQKIYLSIVFLILIAVMAMGCPPLKEESTIGLDWTERYVPGPMKADDLVSIAVSADGAKLAVADFYGDIRMSSDGGVSWKTATTLGQHNWKAIVSSSDGLKIAACTEYDDYIYISSNGGEVWQQCADLGAKSWEDIAISSDGMNIFAISSDNDKIIYKSGDGGISWTEKTIPYNVLGKKAVAVSSDGQTIIFAPSVGYLFLSINGGLNWSEISANGDKCWCDVAISSDGNRIYAVSTTASLELGRIYTSADKGQTWSVFNEPTDPSGKFKNIVTSNNGQKIVANKTNEADICVSNDNGDSWNYISSTSLSEFANGNSAIAIAGDGSRILVADTYLYNSSNNGNTWSEITNVGPDRDWRAVAVSNNGQKIAAVFDFGLIALSNDGGFTWEMNRQAGVARRTSVCISDDGSKMVASEYYGYINVSTNGGTTWNNSTVSLGQKSWKGVAVSADCSRIIAVDGNNIFISSNGGNDWIQCNSAGTRDWNSVASSSNGMVLVASVFGGEIYKSNDGGTTWVACGVSAQWNSLSVSSDGTIIAAVANNGNVYISNNGSSFIPRSNAGVREWTSVAVSDDGKIITAATNNGFIYVTDDNGSTWMERTGAGLRNWSCIAASQDGNKLVAGALGCNSLFTSP